MAKIASKILLAHFMALSPFRAQGEPKGFLPPATALAMTVMVLNSHDNFLGVQGTYPLCVSYVLNKQKSPSGTFLPEGLTQEVRNVEDVYSRRSPHDQLLSVNKRTPAVLGYAILP